MSTKSGQDQINLRSKMIDTYGQWIQELRDRETLQNRSQNKLRHPAELTSERDTRPTKTKDSEHLTNLGRLHIIDWNAFELHIR